MPSRALFILCAISALFVAGVVFLGVKAFEPERPWSQLTAAEILTHFDKEPTFTTAGSYGEGFIEQSCWENATHATLTPGGHSLIYCEVKPITLGQYQEWAQAQLAPPEPES